MDDPVRIVRTMWEAFRDGDMDAVIATMDRQVVWTPLTRPARTLYSGHDGIRRFRADTTAIHGPYRSVADTYTLLPDGSVGVKGRVFVETDGDPFLKLNFEAVC